MLEFARAYAASAAASAEAAAISSFMASVKSGLAGMLTASALMAAADFKTHAIKRARNTLNRNKLFWWTGA